MSSLNIIINLNLFFFSDIQEFYEITLLDDSKSVQQKTAETLQIANKWEISSGPITTHIKDVSIRRVFVMYSIQKIFMTIFLCLPSEVSPI